VFHSFHNHIFLKGAAKKNHRRAPAVPCIYLSSVREKGAVILESIPPPEGVVMESARHTLANPPLKIKELRVNNKKAKRMFVKVFSKYFIKK